MTSTSFDWPTPSTPGTKNQHITAHIFIKWRPSTNLARRQRVKDLPELTSLQVYAGTAAPFNFNGLVRHYYLRDSPEQGDL